MESSGTISNSHENGCLEGSNNSKKESSTDEEVFVNSAEKAWNERRKQWVGDSSQRVKRTLREPIMSWTTTYEELLSSMEPFQQPIPLAEMVDFLVDIWHEEGLYD